MMIQAEQQVKVFCIGLNKTGTTSIGDALKILGFNRFGWRPAASAQLVNHWHEGRFEPFLSIIDNHDAFEDLPWPLVFKEIEERYPNAKFILTVRSSESVWLKSIQKHLHRGSAWVGHFLIYGSYDPVKDERLYIEKYRRHNEEVREYFASKPGKLIEMCFENGDDWDKLCGFLGISEIPPVGFPHSNSAKLFEQSPVEEQSKAFCIGLNKTGAGAVGNALEILGYKRLGWRPGISGRLVSRWHEKDFSSFTRLIKDYSAFDNLPWPLVFKEVEEICPDAKFILTVRADETAWIKAMQKQIHVGSKWVGNFLVYGSYDPVKDQSVYLEKYKRHITDVRDYFASKPGKLIEVCIENGDGWHKLCNFLEISEEPNIPFPQSKTSQ
jgi:hypothetical protein